MKQSATITMKTSLKSHFLAWMALSTIALVLILASTKTVSAQEPDACSAALTLIDHDRAWRFRVYLDEKPIGCHHYFLEDEGETSQLQSIADFEYRMLFIKLYEYQHKNLETWRDGCLDRIESDTNANGKPFYVRGQQQNQNLLVDNGKEQQALDGCVMSFAYWNPEFLKASRLLNTQNGEYLDVEVDELLPLSVEVDGRVENRSHYRLKAKDLAMELWYSEEGEWLALQTEAKAGRTLRYERMDPPVIKQENAP